MVRYFIGVDIINRVLHGRAEIRDFSATVEKYFTRSLRSVVKYFPTLTQKSRISARSHLYGLGYPRQPFQRGNFSVRLYVKT